MSLLDLIGQAGGGAAIEQIAARVGLSPDQARSAIAALSPAVGAGLGRQARAGALGDLLGTASGPDRLFSGVADPVAFGNDVLGQIFGSKEASRQVAAGAAAQTGLGEGTLKALLPLLASLAAGAMASRAGPAGTGAGSGGLDGLIGMLDLDGDGSVMDDLAGLAGRFLSR